MRVSHHRGQPSLLTTVLSLGICLVAAWSAKAAPQQLSAVARDVTSTPGAAELRRRHGSLPEDEFQMRFQLLESGPVARWHKLDLSTQSQKLRSEARDGVITITLPNGGVCRLRLAQAKDREAVYELTFSSLEAGLATTVPVKAGDALLLGAPQNNAHDASFVVIVIN